MEPSVHWPLVRNIYKGRGAVERSIAATRNCCDGAMVGLVDYLAILQTLIIYAQFDHQLFASRQFSLIV